MVCEVQTEKKGGTAVGECGWWVRREIEKKLVWSSGSTCESTTAVDFDAVLFGVWCGRPPNQRLREPGASLLRICDTPS